MANLSPWRTGLLGFLALTALATLAGLFKIGRAHV